MNDRAPDEIQELQKLQKEAAARPELEQRVVAALRRQDLLRQGPARLQGKRIWWWMSAAAAMVVFFGAGWWVGLSQRASQPPALHPTYLLLLREGPAHQAVAAVEEQRRVQEYVAWAQHLAESGVGVRGEKLKADERLLGAGAEAPESQRGSIAGFFLLEAGSYEEAVRIASDCPHLRYGGTIEVRPIEQL